MASDDGKPSLMSLILTELETLNRTLITLTAHVREIAEASRKQAPRRRAKPIRSIEDLTDEEIDRIVAGDQTVLSDEEVKRMEATPDAPPEPRPARQRPKRPPRAVHRDPG
jgi:hypothetical protein